jgi:hypothetical protein
MNLFIAERTVRFPPQLCDGIACMLPRKLRDLSKNRKDASFFASSTIFIETDSNRRDLMIACE